MKFSWLFFNLFFVSRAIWIFLYEKDHLYDGFFLTNAALILLGNLVFILVQLSKAKDRR